MLRPKQFTPGASQNPLDMVRLLVNCRRTAANYLKKRQLPRPQVNWQQIDALWEEQCTYMPDLRARVPEPPSRIFRSNMYAAFYSDLHGLRNLDQIGVENVLVETDFPHTASTWPNSRDVMREQTEAAGLDDATVEKITRGNARSLFRLDG